MGLCGALNCGDGRCALFGWGAHDARWDLGLGGERDARGVGVASLAVAYFAPVCYTLLAPGVPAIVRALAQSESSPGARVSVVASIGTLSSPLLQLCLVPQNVLFLA